LEEPLAEELLTGRVKEGDRIIAEACGDRCLFRVVKDEE
jgi:hypothetical protein